MTMETVYQKDANGCWIACVSMLTGVDYDNIRSRFRFQGAVTGRAAGPVVQLFDELGFQCDEKSTKLSKVRALRELKENAIVYTKNLDEDGDEVSGHWMVWDADGQVLRDPEGWAADRRRIIKNFRIVTPKRDKQK